MEKTIVTFTRAWGRYNAGEIAGFHAAEAAQILGRVARLYTPGDSAPVVSPTALDEREARLNALAAQLAAQQADLERQRAELVGETAIEPEDAPEADAEAVTEAEPVQKPKRSKAEAAEAGAPPAQGG